ncbi:hypothetical protein OQA88_9698 [Cercophora sp. LCS_1]
MPLELRDVTFKDGNSIANVYISAFFSDPFHKTLYPGIPFDIQVAGVQSRWPRNYGDLAGRYKKVVDTTTGQVISYSKWGFVSTDAGGELGRPLDLPKDVPTGPPATPEGLNEDFAEDFTDRVMEIKDRVLGDRPHIYLKMLGTHPIHQRRGAADLQLRWASEVADKNGLAIWVDASPVSVQLCLKHGFVAKGEVVCDLHPSVGRGGGKYKYTSMLREPVPKY